MAANFEVKFIVDRIAGSYQIRITDTSTDFTLAKANIKITYPDGYVSENTDLSNPDINTPGGYVSKALRLDVNNKPVTGDYKINFTGYDASDNEYTSQKQFNFTWSEKSILIQDLSDSGIPVVKFKDINSWAQPNFTAVATTREFSVDYPSTSAISGTSKTESETNLSSVLEIDMVNNLNYYEGVYDVTLSVDITYTHTNGYLTVQYKKDASKSFPIKRTPSQSDLLNKINQYKENIDEYKTTSPSVYAKYAEEYDNVLALYSHAVSRYKLGIGDGAQDSIEELLELIDDKTVHVYLSTPLTSFSIDEDDFGANALITKLKSEIGTFDSDGNLQTVAKAFADEVFEVDATDFKAEASKLSTLLAQFGTYDPNTDTFSFLATADYFEQVKTYADDNSASAVALDILFAQFGTYDAETETFTFSSTSDYFEEVKAYADNDKASATALNTLTSQFGTYDPQLNTFIFNANSDYFDEVKTYADENSAAASKISSIGSAFGSFDGNTFNFSEAKITQELNTYTGLDFSSSTYFIGLESEIDNKPLVFRQGGSPSSDEPVGSIWYDTDNDNKVYILVAGTPNVWTLTDDSRIGASASKITSLSSKFGSFDGNDFTLNNTDSDYWNAVKTYADTNSAAATKVENLGAELVTFNTDGTVQQVSLSSNFTSAIDTFVSDTNNSALASTVEGIRVDLEGQDGTGGLTASVSSNSSAIVAKPDIFRQDAAPATTEAVGSLWFDTDDNNKAYVLVAGDPNNVWTETRDEAIISDIEGKPFIFRQDAAPATTNPEGSLWYDTDDNNKLYVLVGDGGDPETFSWSLTQDGDIATAQATADGRPKVFRQDDAPATTEPEFSIWYDTNDNNLSYVLLGDGGDPETFTWTATIDGRVTDLLSFAESKYSLTADANGVVTGLELYSASGANTVVSTFKITADKFIVRESSTDFVPFALDGNQLKLDVPLNGVSGTFSGELVAASGTFTGSLRVGETDTAVTTVVSGAALGATANQDDTATILAGEHTGSVSGNVTGTIDGTDASTVKSGAADGANAKGVTDDLTGVVEITSSDIAIVNADETKAFYDAGTPFYVDNAGDFSLGDKLKYDNSENLLTISGAVTIESVSGLTKSDVGLGNVDNNSTETILAGNLTGSVDGAAASTVKTGAANGTSAKGETDKLTSVVTLTSTDISIVNDGETKTFNDDGTPFYVDNAGQFSLGDKLSYDPTTNTLSITGAVTIESVSGLTKTDVGLANVDNTSVANILNGTSGDFSGNLSGNVDGTSAATVKSGAADGASAKQETDKLTSVVTLTNSDIAIVNADETKTFYDAGTPFYVDNNGDFSLGDKLKYDNSENLLTISGAVTIESVSGLTKSDVGLSNVDNTSTADILNGTAGDFTGDVTGTVDGTSASTVKSNAADGASAKGVTDNLESNVTLTSTKIYQGTGNFNNSNTGFYLDNTGQFSLKDKLSFDGTTLSVDGEITSTSGNIGGWEINSTELKSPAVSSVNRLKFSPTAGFIVNDDNNQTALLVNYGGLSTLSSTTTGVTFADVSNAEVASWDETVTGNSTTITIPSTSEQRINSSSYLTSSFENANTGGAYSYEITVDAISGALATISSGATYAKVNMHLHVEIATDTGFNNVIKDVELWGEYIQGASSTITFPGVTKSVSFSITDSTSTVYLRFYWRRFYALRYTVSSITFSPKTFNVSSADANDDLVFLIYKGTTELTNEGVQIINDPTTYFKVDRSNFTSGNPYVDIGGDVKVDGDLEVTGSINIVGDVENSDVSVSNLEQRLGEIDSNISIGNSSSVGVTFPGNVTFSGGITNGDVSVTNLETRLAQIDSNINIGHSSGVTLTVRDNLVVAGDLTVQGNTTTENSTQLHISDSLIHLADGNENSDSIDIGFVGHYSPDGGTTAQHAGIFRDADNGEWYVFDEYVDANLDSDTNPTNVIDRADSSFSLGVVNATTFKGNLTGDVTGAVTGTVSSISNHDTDDLDEGSTNLYFTTARARGAISSGTGVSITNGEISIGQSVATTANVTFASISGDGSGLTNLPASTDDLQDITDNGATTTNSITIGGTSSGALASNKQGIVIEGTGGRLDAAQDGTEKLPILQFYDSVSNYGSGTATAGELRGGVEWYTSETTSNFPAISGAIYSINENTYNTIMGLGFYTNANTSSPVEVMRLNGGGGLDLKLGDYKVNATTVIDSSRNINAVDGTFSGDLEIGGTTVIDSSRNITAETINAGGDIVFANNDITRLIRSNVNGGAIAFVGNGDATTSPDRGLFLGSVDNSANFTTAAQIVNNNDFDLLRGSFKVSGTTVIDQNQRHYGLQTASNSVPAFTFSGDSDTGLSRIGTNAVGLVAGGSRKFYVNGTDAYFQNLTGAVNISSDLDVTGNIQIGGTTVINSLRVVSHQGIVMSDGTGIDQLKTYSQSLTLSTSWQDTGINGTDLATGTYIFELYTNDYGVGGGHYEERYSGIMAWLSSNTNSTVADEIVISSRAGHAPNDGDIQLRILRTSSADTDDLKLQIKANYSATGARTYVFKFRRVI